MTTVFTGKKLLVIESGDWEYAERRKAKEAVAVIAVTQGKLVLVEQRRIPVNNVVIDVPAGLVGDEEGNADPAETAKRELKEEAGCECESVDLLARGPSSPGITSELVSFYRANYVRRTGKGGGVGQESINVHLIQLDKVEQWLRTRESKGALIDLKVWTALYFLAKESASS